MNISTSPNYTSQQVAPRKPNPSNSYGPLVAENITKISTTSQSNPLDVAKSSENNKCHSFCSDSANGKPLGDVNGTKNINFFYQYMSKNSSKVNELEQFAKVMSQGNENSITSSNIMYGTKASLALFKFLPEDKIEKVKDQAVAFYKSMLTLSNDGTKEKNANKALEKFSNAIFEQLGIDTNGANKQENLDSVCQKYLQDSVYPDIIEKLSTVLDVEQLQELKANPEIVLQKLYPELNKANDENISKLKEGFLKHKEGNNKAPQMFFLMTALEHKTQIIARRIEKNTSPDSAASQPNTEPHLQHSPPAEPPIDYDMGLPASLPNTKAYSQRSPMPEPLIDYRSAPATTQPVGSFSPVFSPSINVSPIINNNINELLTPLAPVFNKLADALDRVTLLTERLLPGNIESTRRADIPDVVVPTTRGQSEKIISDVVTSGTTDKAEKIVPDEVKVEKQPQPATTVSKARPPLIEKEKPVIDDEIDSSSASIVDAVSIPPLTDKPVPPVIPVPASSVEYKVNSQANEVPSKAPVKKTTYQLNSQGGYFGTQGNVLPSYKDVPVVALTNGAISGSSQSSSYRKSGMRYLAQKNASPTAVELADARKAKETESTQAPKSLNASGSEFMGISSEVIDLFQKHNDASSVKNMDKAQSKVLGSVSPTRQRLSYEQLTQGGKYKEVLGSILKEQDNDKLVSVDQQDKASASGASV